MARKKTTTSASKRKGAAEENNEKLNNAAAESKIEKDEAKAESKSSCSCKDAKSCTKDKKAADKNSNESESKDKKSENKSSSMSEKSADKEDSKSSDKSDSKAVDSDAKANEEAKKTDKTNSETNSDKEESKSDKADETDTKADDKSDVAEDQDDKTNAEDDESEASADNTTEEKLDQVAKKDTSDKSKAADVSAETEKDVKNTPDDKEETTAKSAKEEKAKAKEKPAKASKSRAKDSDNDEDQPVDDIFKSHIIVVTSGKGGVGKTTSAASISTGLALRGHKTCVIDFDVGLRNLDLIMGCERRVVYDFINVLNGEARLNQALIRDKNTEGGNLYVLAASQTKDKDSLTYAGVGRVLKELSDMGFEYIVCDSPAGIEQGALIALYYADTAVVTTNPEISSVRDSDRIIGILDAKSRRAANGWKPVEHRLLLTRYVPSRVRKDEMLSLEDIHELLTIPLLGVIPESADVLKASNKGVPIILNEKSEAGMAYSDSVERLLGKDVPLRFMTENKSWIAKLFGK